MKKFELYDIPYFDTFFGYVSYISEKFPDSVGICQYDRRGNLTERSYGQLGRDVFAAARAIKADGFAGKHIAIVGENCYEWLAAFLAINCAGAVAVPVDIEQPDETIRAMPDDAPVTTAIFILRPPDAYTFSAPILLGFAKLEIGLRVGNEALDIRNMLSRHHRGCKKCQ